MFWLYLIVNVILIPVYVFYFYGALMATGMGWPSDASIFVKLLILTIVSALPILPNLIVLIIASLITFYRKKNVKKQVSLGSIFMGITFVVYLIAFGYYFFIY